MGTPVKHSTVEETARPIISLPVYFNVKILEYVQGIKRNKAGTGSNGEKIACSFDFTIPPGVWILVLETHQLFKARGETKVDLYYLLI